MNNNYFQAVDKDLVELFNDLNKSGSLNNTLLILMSDHGHRFTTVRDTLQGKMEERMPLLSLLLPPWFGQTFPTARSNLEKNKKRLTTPLDIHATLKHLLRLRQDVNNKNIEQIPGTHKYG